MSVNSSESITNILNNLGIIAKINPGQTLSPSSMTIIDHNTWATSLWRTYAGENRKATITFIKNIFNEAFDIYELSPLPEILVNIKLASNGFANLKETYSGDYYTIGEINLFLESIEQNLKKIARKSEQNPLNYFEESEFEPLIADSSSDDLENPEDKESTVASPEISQIEDINSSVSNESHFTEEADKNVSNEIHSVEESASSDEDTDVSNESHSVEESSSSDDDADVSNESHSVEESDNDVSNEGHSAEESSSSDEDKDVSNESQSVEESTSSDEDNDVSNENHSVEESDNDVSNESHSVEESSSSDENNYDSEDSSSSEEDNSDSDEESNDSYQQLEIVVEESDLENPNEALFEDAEPETRFQIPFELLPEISSDVLEDTNANPPSPPSILSYPDYIFDFPEIVVESQDTSAHDIPIDMAFQPPKTDPMELEAPHSIYNFESIHPQESSRSYRSFSDNSYLHSFSQDIPDIKKKKRSPYESTPQFALDIEESGSISSSPDCLCGGCYPGWICSNIHESGSYHTSSIVYTKTWSVSNNDIEAQEYTLFGRSPSTGSDELGSTSILPQISTVPPIIRIAEAFIKWLESSKSESDSDSDMPFLF